MGVVPFPLDRNEAGCLPMGVGMAETGAIGSITGAGTFASPGCNCTPWKLR